MVASGGGSSREVVIMLRTEVDRKASATALREQAKLVKDAQTQATTSAKESSRDIAKIQSDRMRSSIAMSKRQERESVKAVKDAEREHKAIETGRERRQKEQSRRTVAILKQQEREAVKAAKDADRVKQTIAREQGRRQKEMNRRTIAIIKQQERETVAAERAKERAVKDTQQSQQRALSAHEQASGKLVAMNDQATEAFKMSLSGAMSLGRGVAMLGLVGEKDTQKLLEGLIKIQAAFDIMRGSIETVQGLTRAWKAYRAAVAAAAAARTTLTAAQTVGGVVSGAAGGMAARGRVAAGRSVAGDIGLAAAGNIAGEGVIAGTSRVAARRAAGGIGGAVAGGAGGAAALGLGAKAAPAVGGAGLVTGAGIGAVAGVGAAGVSTFQFGRDVGQFGFMGGAEPGSWLDYIATKEMELDVWLTRKTGLGVESARQVISSGAAARRAQGRVAAARLSQGREQRARESARQQFVERADLRERDFGATEETISRTLAESARTDDPRIREMALTRAIEFRRKELDIVKQTNREQAQAARRQISALTQQHAQHLKTAQTLRERGTTLREQFGSMTASEQAQIVAIRRKIDRGGDLTRREEFIIEPFADVGRIGQALSSGRLARGKAAGSEEVFAEFAGGRGDLEVRAEALERKARQVEGTIRVKEEIAIKLETDETVIVRSITRRIRELLDARRVQTEKAVEEAQYERDVIEDRVTNLEQKQLQEASL